MILDLTTLEKCGKFKEFDNVIRVYNRKRGLHLVVMYLVVGQWRIPWSFRVWRGKGTPSPAQLGLKLLRNLPKSFTKHFQVMILADTAFGSADFIHGVRALKYHAVTGLLSSRRLTDGRCLKRLHKRGQHLRLQGFHFPVWVSWFYLKRHDGKRRNSQCCCLQDNFCLALLIGGVSVDGRLRVGKRAAKHRFGLHRFGQGTLLGVYRWLILSLIAYILAHWAYLSLASTSLPDWGEAAQIAFQTFLPQLFLCSFLLDIERLRPIALSYGIDIHISRCKI